MRTNEWPSDEWRAAFRQEATAATSKSSSSQTYSSVEQMIRALAAVMFHLAEVAASEVRAVEPRSQLDDVRSRRCARLARGTVPP